MTKINKPGAFYGANVQGADRAARSPSGGDDRPSASPRDMEATMNIPGARQIPVEGAVTGPQAPPAEVDEVYETADLDDLEDLTRS